MTKIYVNLVQRAGGISWSYPFLGICEAIFRVRDLFFVWNLILVYILHISNLFEFGQLEPAPGCPAHELEVKELKIFKLDVLKQAPGCPN